MIQTPIRQVLLTMQASGTRTLLMGGQACVFYGAAQVSKNVDFLILADTANFKKLHDALATLAARRIAVPSFDLAVLERGHAVHFRCSAPGVEGLRIDVMSRLRDLSSFDNLWERRTIIGDAQGHEFHLLSVPDLVKAKKRNTAPEKPACQQSMATRENQRLRQAFAHPKPSSPASRVSLLASSSLRGKKPAATPKLSTRSGGEALQPRKAPPLVAALVKARGQ